MKLVTDTPISIEEKRRMIVKLLWEQGFRPHRVLDVCLREALFEASQLYSANEPSQRAVLFEIVRSEFRTVEKEKIEERRALINELLSLTMSERAIAQHLLKNKLLPSRTWTQAYNLTRKECLRAMKGAKIEHARRKPGASNIFKLQMGRIFRDALAGAQRALENEDTRGAASLMSQAIKAAENIAIIDGVDINGKDREKQRGFDAATEAARAIIEATEEAEAEAALEQERLAELAEAATGTES